MAATVGGATLEPGLRGAVEAAVARRSAERGTGAIRVDLTAVETRPLAASVAGTAAWSSALRADVGRADLPGCGGEVRAERVWVAGAAADVPAERGLAMATLADEIARRAVAAVEARCP